MKGRKNNLVNTGSMDEYISAFPSEVKQRLSMIREMIREIAPDSVEAIKYGIPTFILNGNLIHFAAFKNHIGLYPTPTGMDAFAKELSIYKQGKGSVQFPLDQELPLGLIRRIVEYRVSVNRKK